MTESSPLLKEVSEHWVFQCSDFMKRYISIITAVLVIISGFFFANYRVVQDKAIILFNRDQNIETILPAPGGVFTVSYIHSVHRTPVYETYFIDENNRLTLREVKYDSLGVGMPYTDEGGAFINDDGQFVLRFDRTYDMIPIRLSPIPEHALEVGGKTYSLMEFAKPNERIDLYAADKWTLKTISRKER